ncbi:helix-turn-helix transcriptional regulator [Bacillus thuringiensis]
MNGKTLRYIRVALGYTREQFAQLLRVTSTTVYRWEAEVHAPTKEAQKHIQDVLRFTQDDIDEINRLLLEQRHNALDAKLREQAGL